MNRYQAWLGWRLRQSFVGLGLRQVGWVLSFGLLLLLQAGVLGLSSPRAVEILAQWWKEPASQQGPSSNEPRANSPLSDPLAQTGSPDDVRRALSDLMSRPDWLVNLEQRPLVRPGTIVHVSASHALSDRQQRLMQVQGMKVMPWSEPGQGDRLTPAPEFWIQRTDAPGWVIHARPLDVSPPDPSQPGELVVLRTILWIEALDELERWQAANPAPVPPAELNPAGVDVQLLTSTASNQMMALACAWLGVLLVMSLVALSQLSAWERRRAGGLWVPLAGLSHQTYPWLVAQSLVLVLPLLLATLLAGSLAWIIYQATGMDVDARWLWRLPLMLALSAWWVHAVSGLIGVLPRVWARVLAALWVLLLSGGTLWVSEQWLALRPAVEVFISSPALGLAFLVGAMTLACLRLTAWILDRRARAGYQSIW